MDAMMFIVIIGLAVVVITQIDDSGEDTEHQELNEACTTLFESTVDPNDFGIEYMKPLQLYDLYALFLILEKHEMTEYISDSLHNLYPWENSIACEITYGEYTQMIGQPSNEYTQHCEINYDVQYGGTLNVSAYLYS